MVANLTKSALYIQAELIVFNKVQFPFVQENWQAQEQHPDFYWKFHKLLSTDLIWFGLIWFANVTMVEQKAYRACTW